MRRHLSIGYGRPAADWEGGRRPHCTSLRAGAREEGVAPIPDPGGGDGIGENSPYQLRGGHSDGGARVMDARRRTTDIGVLYGHGARIALVYCAVTATLDHAVADRRRGIDIYYPGKPSASRDVHQPEREPDRSLCPRRFVWGVLARGLQFKGHGAFSILAVRPRRCTRSGRRAPARRRGLSFLVC
jgi:hypothetical protein